MNTSIQFLRDPEYRDSVLLFVLTPAGIIFDPGDIGKNLFGSRSWTHEILLIEGLSPKAIFRYSDIGFHWTDFLDLAFQHADHTLFFVPQKGVFREIVKENLVQQNPDLYSFSFHKFNCDVREGLARQAEKQLAAATDTVKASPVTEKQSIEADSGIDSPQKPVHVKSAPALLADEKLMDARSALRSLLEAGWSANGVSRITGITSMTIGSIRNGKSAQISTRVYNALMNMKADADAGRIVPSSGKSAFPTVQSPKHAPRASARPEAVSVRPTTGEGQDETPLVHEQFVAVDAEKLIALLGRLSTVFSEGMEELREMRSLLTEGKRR